jgi:hypothetical protein
MKIMKLAAGFAIGYVLGSRAGRDTYQKIAANARQLGGHPRVQQAQEKAKGLVSTGTDKATEKLRQARPSDSSASSDSTPSDSGSSGSGSLGSGSGSSGSLGSSVDEQYTSGKKPAHAKPAVPATPAGLATPATPATSAASPKPSTPAARPTPAPKQVTTPAEPISKPLS